MPISIPAWCCPPSLCHIVPLHWSSPPFPRAARSLQLVYPQKSCFPDGVFSVSPLSKMPSRAGIFQNKYQMAQPGLALNPDGDGECMGGDLVCVGSPFHCYFWCGVENILIFHFLLNLSIAFGLSSQHRTGSSKHQSLALALPDRNGQNLPAKTKKLLQNMGLSSFHLLSALQVFEDYTWKL